MAINVSTDSPASFIPKLAEKAGTVKQAAPGGFAYVKVEVRSPPPLPPRNDPSDREQHGIYPSLETGHSR